MYVRKSVLVCMISIYDDRYNYMVPLKNLTELSELLNVAGPRSL